MAPSRPQDLSTHRRWLPMWHFVAFPLTIVNVILASWHAIRIPTRWNMWQVAMAVALVLICFSARVMALIVQDRLIQLEMRLRLKEVLTGALASRIGDLTPKQLVGLRFAGNAELPGLVERCLSGELANDEAVKKQVKDWQADWLRA